MAFEFELARVLQWLDATDPIAMRHFSTNVPARAKADGTPVTEADTAIERELRAAIARDFPGDAIVGEEFGAEPAAAGARRWILDPIDGTKSFARGIPAFATLVALEDGEGRALGVVSAPALRTRWWATRGSGAFRQTAVVEPIHVSTTAGLADADLMTGGLDWAKESCGFERAAALLEEVRRHRALGDFWGHVLVAQGSVEAMLELAPLARWDIPAFRIVVEEAGGRVTDLGGGHGFTEGPCLSSNGRVHDAILAVVGTRGVS